LKRLVSVIIPTYNAQFYIKEAVLSILEQSYDNLQILILDDGSTDDTVSLIRSFNDSRIEIHCSTQNWGQAFQLNLGISLAKGEFIAIMHADDIALKDKLLKQIEFLNRHPLIGVCGCFVNLFGDKYGIWSYPESNQSCKNMLLNSVPFAHSTVVIRSSVIKQLNCLYEQDMVPAEDYDLWIKLATKTEFANLQEPLLNYRIHQNQIGHTENDKLENVFIEIRKRLIKSFFKIENEQQINGCLMALYYYESVTETKNVTDAISFLWKKNKETQFFSDSFFKGRLRHIVYHLLSKTSLSTKLKCLLISKELIKITFYKTFFRLLVNR
jgi:glycosyltransferase involved in cell wall biosynthesis